MNKTFNELFTFSRASTATRVNEAGLIESVAADQPRFDYDPVTLECKGILIEEARTNLILHSQDFSNAYWTKGDATIASSAVTAPDGVGTFQKIEETTANNWHGFYPSARLTYVGRQSVSMFVKAAERNYFFIRITGIDGYGYFDLQNGLASTSGGGTPFAEIKYFGNGVYRCTLTATTTVVTDVTCGTATGMGLSSFTQFAGTTGYGVYVWGYQDEAGSFATSYIPTTTAQVTRAADVCSITGQNFKDWYRQDEGTVYVEASTFDNQYPTALCIGDGTSANKILVQGNSSVTAQQLYILASSAVQVNLASQPFVTSGTKTASAYALNNFAYSTNGTAVSTDVSGTVPLVTQLTIGVENTSNHLNGHIKSIRYFPKRLSDAELQALTS